MLFIRHNLEIIYKIFMYRKYKYYFNGENMIEMKDLRNVKNIMIFLSDSLRWDYLPNNIKKRGLSIKSVSSSNCTAPSLSSMVTGLYPFRNGVFTFSNKLPKRAFNILNSEKINCSFRTENTWTTYDSYELNPIFRMLNQKKSIPLNKIKPPFIYIEDEKGGHCPYGWYKDDIYREGDCLSFFKDYGKKNISKLLQRYKKGIERSVEEFNNRMDIIIDRGLEESTLIIFCSDHGELLGEYGGLVTHGNMLVPELVYVPITFIHPNIENKIISNQLMRHVDLVPTIVEILGIKVNQKFDGYNIFEKGLSKFGYSYWKFNKEKEINKYKVKVSYEERGLWSINGGYVFKKSFSLGAKWIKATYDLIHPKSVQSIYYRGKLCNNPFQTMTNIPKYYNGYVKSKKVFNKPNIEIEDAKKLIYYIENKKINYDNKNTLKNTIDKLKLKNI